MQDQSTFGGRKFRTARQGRKFVVNDMPNPEAPPDWSMLQAAYRSLYASIPQFESAGAGGISAGVRIETSRGIVPVQALNVGDLIRTADKGFLPLLWKGATRGPGRGRDAPVLVQGGALGNERGLLVSPRHRILLSGWSVDMLFNQSEVLATAKSIVNDRTVWRLEMDEVVYFHLLLEDHSIVFAEGCPLESLHIPTLDWDALSETAQKELIELLEKIGQTGDTPMKSSARSILNAYESCLVRTIM